MNRLEYLIRKYIADEISADERRELKRSLNVMSDDELGDALQNVWEGYEGNIKNGNETVYMTPDMEHKKKSKSVLLIFSRVAAAAMLILMLGTSIWLYKDNFRLSTFLNREIEINVESGDKASLTLPDGTEIFLNAATTVSYPSNFGFAKRNIHVEGEVYMKVFKNPASPFIINTDRLQIEVLGTEFNLATCDNNIETTLVEGSVKITTKGSRPETVFLVPNEKAVFDKTSGKISISKTSTRFETAWTRGELVFRSLDFKQIAAKLEQRFGMKVEIPDDKYDHSLFTGSFRENSVYEVLKKLQVHYKFRYETDKDEKIKIKFIDLKE